MEAFRSALRNLSRKRVRTAITLSGIAVGVLSVLIIGAVGAAGTRAVNNELDSLGVNGVTISVTKGKGFLTNDDLKTVKELNLVEKITPIISVNAEVSRSGASHEAMVWGIESGEQIISVDVKYGRVFTPGDIEAAANRCVVDVNMAQKLYRRDNIVGKTIRIDIDDQIGLYEVVGVVSAESGILSNLIGEAIPTFVYIPYTKMQQLLRTERLAQIAAAVPQGADYDAVMKSLETSLKARGENPYLRIEDLSKQRDRLGKVLDIVAAVLSAIGGISLLVAGLGIMTVMLVSVNERTREIGIKKALGAKKHHILFEFLCEALLISLGGSAAGVTFGLICEVLIEKIFGFRLDLAAGRIAAAVSVAVLTALVFGVYPAAKAAKLRPADALRQE